MSDELIEYRRDYSANTLSSDELAASPIDQFKHWMRQARDANILDASAMALATADTKGQPHVRMVLLKKVDESGFAWYTYQESDKGAQLAENPQDADEYFYSRPEGSRFSAAASIQSAPISNRSELESKVGELHALHPDGNVPRPNVWGGYLLQPARFEFWQGRDDRLHDRFIYEQNNTGSWHTQRLSP